MNLCILMGKIISKIEFKFIIGNKNKSIVYFELQLLNKNRIKAKAYNKTADYIYRRLESGDIVAINGELKTDGTLEIIEIYKMK